MNWDPSRRHLRQFGFGMLVALPVLGWLWAGNNPVAWGWTVGGGVTGAAIGWFRPHWLRPLFLGLSLVTLPIGWLVSELLLLAVFGCLVWPIGCVRRLLAGDPLQRTPDRNAETYWQPKPQPPDAASYFRQF